jgi:hypothetical protein
LARLITGFAPNPTWFDQSNKVFSCRAQGGEIGRAA